MKTNDELPLGWEDALPTILGTQSGTPPEMLMKRLRLADEYLKEEQGDSTAPRLLYRWDDKVHTLVVAEPQVVIGRGEGWDCTFPDTAMSRPHFRVRPQNGEYILRDLDSKNGTRVNGEPCSERVLIPGDLIEAGSVMFIFIAGHR